MAEHYQIDDAEQAGQVPGTSGQVQNRPQEQVGQGETQPSLKVAAIGFIERAMAQTKWYNDLDIVTQGFLQGALDILKHNGSVTDSEIKEIMTVALIGGVLLTAFKIYQPSETAEHVPYKAELDQLSRWLSTDLKDLLGKIKQSFSALEKVLEDFSAAGGDFNGREWKLFKVKKKILESNFDMYVDIVKESRGDLLVIKTSFERNDATYQHKCRYARSANAKFFAGSSLTFLSTLGIVLWWKNDLLEKINTTAAYAAVATIAAGGPAALGGWSYHNYASAIDIGPQLNQLNNQLIYHEKQTGHFGKRLEDMSESKIRQVMADFKFPTQAEG